MPQSPAPQFNPAAPFQFDTTQPFKIETPGGISPTPYTGDPTRKPVSAEDFIDSDGDGIPDSEEDKGWIGVLKTGLKHFYQNSPLAIAKMAADLAPTNPNQFQNAMKYREDLVNASADQWNKARQSQGFDKVSHALAAIIPMAGPMIRGEADQVGRAVTTGNPRDIAATVGDAAGMATTAAVMPGITPEGVTAPAVVRGSRALVNSLKDSTVGPKIADTLDRMANNRLVKQTVQPGTNKTAVAYGARMNEIAPDLLRDRVTFRDPATGQMAQTPLPDMSAASRVGLRNNVGNALQQTLTDMDGAYAKIPDTEMWETKPLASQLKTKLADLNVRGEKTFSAEDIGKMKPADVAALKAREGTRVGPDGTVKAVTEITPSTNAVRAQTVAQGLDELNQLGENVSFKQLTELAKAWNKGAEQIYTPEDTPGFQQMRDQGMGYADLERTLRDYLAKKHPELAPINAKFHMLKSAQDIMDGAEAIDRVRSTRGPMSRVAGSAAGAAAGEVIGHITGQAPGLGASVGVLVSPIIDAAMQRGVTTQIGVARALARMADALRADKPNLPTVQAAVMNAAKTAGVSIAPDAMTAFRNSMADRVMNSRDFSGSQPEGPNGSGPAGSGPTGPVAPAAGGAPGPEFAPATEVGTPQPPRFNDPTNAVYRNAQDRFNMGRPQPLYSQIVEGRIGRNLPGSMEDAATLASKPGAAATALKEVAAEHPGSAKVDTAIDNALSGLLAEDMTPLEERAARAALQRVTKRRFEGDSTIDPMQPVGRYLQLLNMIGKTGYKLTLDDAKNLGVAADAASLIGRKRGGDVAGGKLTSKLPDTMQEYIASVRSNLPKGKSGGQKGFQVNPLFRLLQSDDILSQIREGGSKNQPVPATTKAPMNPDNPVGRIAVLPDGKEIHRMNDGSFKVRDSRGMETDAPPEIIRLMQKLYPGLF